MRLSIFEIIYNVLLSNTNVLKLKNFVYITIYNVVFYEQYIKFI